MRRLAAALRKQLDELKKQLPEANGGRQVRVCKISLDHLWPRLGAAGAAVLPPPFLIRLGPGERLVRWRDLVPVNGVPPEPGTVRWDLGPGRRDGWLVEVPPPSAEHPAGTPIPVAPAAPREGMIPAHVELAESAAEPSPPTAGEVARRNAPLEQLHLHSPPRREPEFAKIEFDPLRHLNGGAQAEEPTR